MTGIAVAGNRDFVLGFRLAGIKNTFTDGNIEEKISSLIDDKEFNILVIHDEDFNNFSTGTKIKIQESVKPVVISVGKKEEDVLREKIRRVFGIDLYKK